MKVVQFGALALALALPALAQDITSLPQCAQQPILLAISSSGCGLTDIECICKNQDFVNGLVQQIPTLCTPAEVAVTGEFAVQLCEAYRVTLDLPPELLGGAATASGSASGAPSGSATAAATSATAAASSSVPATPTSASVSSGTSASSSHAAATTTSGSHSASTTAATSTSASTSGAAQSSATTSGPAQQTGNAATANTIGFGGMVGALAVGLVAAL